MDPHKPVAHKQDIFTCRVRIPTGLDCNENCKFCYYHGELNTKRYTTGQMRDKLKYARGHGIEDIDFSGGEPTLRKDLVSLIAEAGEMGFRKICIITNGSRIEDRAYLQELVNAGLNEILLSIHGHDAATHNEAVQRKNSWANIEKTVENVHELNIRLRTNTVVTTLNYKTLVEIAEYLIKVKPVAANFICFNDWNRAVSLTEDLACKYSDASPGLCDAIDTMSDRISKVTVRYIPFCFMKGYEKHICGILQNEFDGDEWIDPIKRVLTFNDVYADEAKSYYSSLYEDFLKNKKESLMGIESDYTQEELQDPNIFYDLPARYIRLAHKADNARVRSSYVKSEECAQCSLNLICDGLEKTYTDFVGTGELKRIPGEVVLDPMVSRRSYSYEWK